MVCLSCGKHGHGVGRCPELDETFSYMLLGGRRRRWCQLHDDLATNCRAAPCGKRHLIRGEGSAARISNELRPQDPGGGVSLTASRVRMCALPVDTYGRGSGCEELVSLPLQRGFVERPVPRPAGRHDSPIGSLLKRSRYPQCWSMRPGTSGLSCASRSCRC